MRFECVVHHEGEFLKFKKLGYKELNEVWIVDLDYWSYFEVLGGLRDLRYLDVESLWYCDAMDPAIHNVHITNSTNNTFIMEKIIHPLVSIFGQSPS